MQESLGGTRRAVSYPDRRRHLPIRARFTACGPRMNVPAIGIIHAGPGSLLRTVGEGRTPGPGSFAATTADKRRGSAPLGNAIGCTWTPFPPYSVARPSRRRPCGDTGNRAMRVRGAANRTAERTPRGRKADAAPDIRGISVSCVAFRAARSRLLWFQITRDNCRYRAQYCQSAFVPGPSPHPHQGMASRLQLPTTH